MTEWLTSLLNNLPELSAAGLFFLFFFGTFVSEDAACLLAGTAAASGRISLSLAIMSCFLGIFVGDVLLYGVGRVLGKRVFDNRLVRRLVSENKKDKASAWLENNAGAAVFMSRFLTGLRLPTYLAAGALRTNFLKFAFFFLLASAIWTPILVGSTAAAQSFLFRSNTIVGLVIIAIVVRMAFKFTSRRNRRLFVGRLKRIANWEFWPIQVFYAPVVAYVAWLAIRHRSLTVFTAVNPAIPAGGFKGESKNDIYSGLVQSKAAEPFLLKHCFLARDLSPSGRLLTAWKCIDEQNLSFPLVLKPDAGERGSGVCIVHSADELETLIERPDADMILQEFAGGVEASVFYYRYPDSDRGRIFSITEKHFPSLLGDGRSTLEELILNDPRAVCLAEKYFEQNRKRIGEIPADGEAVGIVQIGTHSRGAIFMDGDWLKTEALENKIDEICRGYSGFYFGRFDIRAASFDDLKRGDNFKIIELNGVTSESTNIYDPKYSLADAYRILFRQWRIAFEIGAENIRRGAKRTSVSDLIRLIFGRKIKSDSSSSTDTRPLTANR